MSDTMDRRTFVKTASAAGISLALGSSAAAQDADARKRYAIVGTGSRSAMFQDAIEGKYPKHAMLVGVCDTNPGRLELARKRSKRNGNENPPAAYAAADFDKMLAETKPQTIIVTTVDSFHHEYIIRALDAG